MLEKVCNHFVGAVAALAIFCLIGACTDSGVPKGQEYLLRVGDRKVSPQEFEQVFEIARVAYPTAAEGDPEVLEVIRHRVLVEMIEELLISLRAEALGIRVTDKELEERIAEIRQDYPDGAFDEIFVEQAIPFELWKRRTRVRLLLDKVIAADLKSSPANGAAAETPPAARDGETIPGDVPGVVEPQGREETEADGAYQRWIRELAEKYPVEINSELWKKRYGP